MRYVKSLIKSEPEKERASSTPERPATTVSLPTAPREKIFYSKN
jgi:hypothetical protein